MKGLTILFFLCLLIPPLAYSQNEYPKLIIIEKDTLCAITIPQVRDLNAVFNSLDEQKETNDSLRSIVSNYQVISDTHERLIKLLSDEIAAQNQIDGNRDVLMEIQEKKIAMYAKEQVRIKLTRNLEIVGLIGAATFLLLRK